MFENTVLSSIFGPKNDEATVGYRKIHHGELHHLHSLTSTNCIIELRTRWTRHVACIGQNIMHVGSFWEKGTARKI